MKEIHKHKISEIEIDITDLEGAFVAADVIDTSTGEVLLEANTELTADKLSKMLEATRRRSCTCSSPSATTWERSSARRCVAIR